MNGLSLRLGQNKKPIAPETVESLFAQGLSRAQVAQSLGLSYKGLSRRIAARLSLAEAEKNGQAKFIASFLNAEVNQ